MKVKFYVDRYTLRMGWVRATSDLGSLAVAKNMKESLAARYGEDVNNFSIVISS